MNIIIICLLVLAVAAAGGRVAYKAGVDAVNARWHRELSSANAKHQASIDAASEQARATNRLLALEHDKRNKRTTENDHAMAHSQATIPLSEACTQCRVPARRVNWMHGSAEPARIGQAGTSGAGPTAHAGNAATSEVPALK